MTTFMMVRNFLEQKMSLLWPRFGKITVICILLVLSMCLWHISDAQAQLDPLTVAVSFTPPFVFASEAGALTGFEIELLDALATQAGLRFTYTTTEFRYLLPGIATRLYDLGGGCIAITPERQARLLFTRPYFASGLTMVVHADNSRIQTLADLTAEKNVAVLDGSLTLTFAQSHITATIHTVPSNDIAFSEVETGEMDSFIVTETEFLAYQMRHPETPLHSIGGLLDYGECGFVVNQADTALLSKLDVALAELKSNGTYDTIYRKWFGSRPQPEKPVEPTPVADLVTPVPSLAPSAVAVEATPALTTSMALAGIYYLTVTKEPTSQPSDRTISQYQLMTLAANGLWFVIESPDPIPDDTIASMLQSGQSGLWYVNREGQVEATLLTFTAATDTAPTEVIRKDYQMQVDGNGHVVGTYQATYYAADLFASIPPPTAAMTQTIKFTGQRVK